MLIKHLGKYVKFVGVFVIVGFVGFLAYLMITGKSVENITVYEVTKPVKRESQPNSHLPSERSHNQGAQIAETSKSQTSEDSESPTLSDTHPTDAHLDTGDADGVDESEEASSDTHDVGDSSTSPQVSAVELRRQTLINRQVEIQAQLEAMAREDGSVAPRDIPKSLVLFEETVRISQELGTLSSDDSSNAFSMIERSKFIASHTTEDGKVPVSIGSQVSDMFEKDGNHEAAEAMRIITQRALENGDEFFKPEHLEVLR